jgi:hypothetical protein
MISTTGMKMYVGVDTGKWQLIVGLAIFDTTREPGTKKPSLSLL